MDPNLSTLSGGVPLPFPDPANCFTISQSPASSAPVSRHQAASYEDPGLECYRHNPLLEALPPILSEDEALKQLARNPAYSQTDRTAKAELRLHLIQNAVQFFQPLPVHLDLEQRFSRLLRAGYQARNPLERGFWPGLQTRVQTLKFSAGPAASWSRPTATGFSILGMSGVGKSSAVEAILSLYPQVILHQRYREQDFNWLQVVWLKLDCPFDGSVKGLCLNFFQALDGLLGTHYYEHCGGRGRASIDEMLPQMARIGTLHSLGVLVIDEIQHLSAAKSGGASRMLNFFVQLVNTIGMPVVLVGTYKALPLLTGEFRQARRGSGQGDLVWDRLKEDAVWQLLVETLWYYQYVRTSCPLTPQLGQVLYDVSQGITDLAVKVYFLAQIRAITTGQEVVNEAIIRSVAADSFRLVNPVLEALRTRSAQDLARYEDVQPLALSSYLQVSPTTATAPTSAKASVSDRARENPAKLKANSTSSSQGPNQAAKTSANNKAPQVAVTPETETGAVKAPGLDFNNNPTPAIAVPEKPGPHLDEVKSGDSLVQIAASGGKRKLTAYEALREAGNLRPAAEYLEKETIRTREVEL